MEELTGLHPWLPKPFSIAVLDSDDYLTEVLCEHLRDRGFVATAFYELPSLMQSHQIATFDAYVLDYLADWQPGSTALENLIGAIRRNGNSDVPVFVLGNHVAPEKVARLEDIIMRYNVRYVLKPIRAAYLAKRIGEALATRAGL